MAQKKRERLAIAALAIILVAAAAGVSASTQVIPDWQQVNSSGFGDALNDEVSALAAFDGFFYAGTHNATDPLNIIDGAQIFRSPDGEMWTPVTDPGFGNSHDTAPPAILDLTVFDGYLYASTGRGDDAAKIFRTLDGTNWAPVVNSGFADPDTVEIGVLAEFNGKLYAGAKNLVSGAQIWSSFTGDSNSWTQVAPTTPGTVTAGVTGMAVFDGGLYAAIESEDPAQIWRTFGGLWEAIVTDGFGDSDTILTGGLAAFGSHLYAGAGNTGTGAQLFRTTDGELWEPAVTPGAGDTNNEKVEMLFVFQDQLYAGLRNTNSGIEIWRTADGTVWEQANVDGFGDGNNSTTNGSNATADFLDQLYVGTANVTDGGELWRMQEDYGVLLSPDQAKSGIAGQNVTYTLHITNTGIMTDSFDLAAGGQTWTTTLSTELVNLAPSAGVDFTVTVAVPPGAANQDSDTVTITATSQGDAGTTDAAGLTTTAVTTPVYGVALSADDSLSSPAGGQAAYTLTLENTGNVEDTFDLLATGNNWATTLSSDVVTLAAGAGQDVLVTVQIPITAAAQESDQVTIQATSQGDSGKSDTAVLTTVSEGGSNLLYLPFVKS